MLILRGHFTSAELAKAFDVSEDTVKRIAGDKIQFKQIGQTRKAVLGEGVSDYIGNNLTIPECSRLLGRSLSDDPKGAFLGITIYGAPDTGDHVIPLEDVIHGYNLYLNDIDDGYWD
ncbi:hypothetical protein [Limosilactobacillus mucosae]|jgi:hypothetical protein|uniref:Uncharacterized protein n=1 Tax=Limosilactobacillus mucosae TaxID=97478 RepID=A0A7L9VSL8_LIMMU|nr:hypothetical protein [Limosilactobacillus mucosae]QOL69379.1 hypothetical protein LM011_08325 [Limosilactobacillus mucosae]